MGCDGVCQPGKQSSGPFKPTGHACSTPLEIVHIALVGPMQRESTDGESYALSMVVGFTEYFNVVLLKNKYDAAKGLVAFIS